MSFEKVTLVARFREGTETGKIRFMAVESVGCIHTDKIG